jgi:hypothetical protein
MKKAIPEYIIDGSITVDSVEAFRGILKEFPGRPELLKMYADLLAARKRTYAAGQHYDQAAALFLNAGRLFSAWVCKLLQWQLHRPSRDQVLEFHQALGSTPHNGAPVDHFIMNLTPAERMAVFSKFDRIRAPAKKNILGTGERRDYLYLVVCGVLQEASCEVPPQNPKFQHEASRILWEADCFGDAYPFSEQLPAQSYVQATTRVELVAISRQHLICACGRFPGVERGLTHLWGFRFGKTKESTPQEVRKEKLYRIRTSMNVLSAAGG